METKKTPGADLERGKTIFFLMGFAVVLSSFFVLLEWQSSDFENSDWTSLGPVFIEKEFEGRNLTEPSTSTVLPEKEKNAEEEIVYEDYTVTDEMQIVEDSPDAAVSVQPEQLDVPLSQTQPEISEQQGLQSEALVRADTMPQFPGGTSALVRYIYENVKYPSAALKQRIEGRVWCSFVVETDGSVSNVRLEEGVYVFLDEEVVRVLKTMPPWIPGRTKGDNVRVKIYIPIVFKR